MAVMVPAKRQVEIKPSHVEAKGRSWQRGEKKGGQCGNAQTSADLSHDTLKDWARQIVAHVAVGVKEPLVRPRIYGHG
jgi:hypothetical protein